MIHPECSEFRSSAEWPIVPKAHGAHLPVLWRLNWADARLGGVPWRLRPECGVAWPSPDLFLCRIDVR